MKSRIILIRHVESMKNLLNACASLDGEEPITNYGRYQAQQIAGYLCKISEEAPLHNLHLYCAGDRRSVLTASSIAEKIDVNYTVESALSSLSNRQTSGLLLPDLLRSNPKFEQQFRLYRAGLISAWDVAWPSGDTGDMQRALDQFIAKRNIFADQTSIIVGHKSSLTCLAFTILRHFGRYPSDFYGYLDIPPGNGILFEIDNGRLEAAMLGFDLEKKKESTDVVIKDGQIVFPESACAVCWDGDKLLLVQQDRNGVLSWELPGGKINPSESPIAAASRELIEETGYRGFGGKLLYSIDLDLSVSIHKTHLVQFDTCAKEGQEEFSCKWFPLNELEAMINTQKITHAQTITAYLEKTRK